MFVSVQQEGWMHFLGGCQEAAQAQSNRRDTGDTTGFTDITGGLIRVNKYSISVVVYTLQSTLTHYSITESTNLPWWIMETQREELHTLFICRRNISDKSDVHISNKVSGVILQQSEAGCTRRLQEWL